MKISKSEAGKLGYLASKETQEKRKQERIDEYYKNPSRCLFCKKELAYNIAIISFVIKVVQLNTIIVKG